MPVLDWIDDLLDKVAEVPAWAIVAGVALESLQTGLAALAWYGILRAALPGSAGLVVAIAIGAVVLLVLLARIFWERLAKLRTQLVSGGAILRTPRRALTRLVLPELGSYLARLGIVAVFLGAYASRSASTTSLRSPPLTRSPTASRPPPVVLVSPRR